MSKTIVISGGSDGLGRVIAQRLTGKHAVVLLSPTTAKVKGVADELGCEYRVCDVSRYAQVRDAMKSVIEAHNTIDCVINNAGLWIEGEIDANDPELIKRVMDVNALGTLNLTKAALPFMKKMSDGLIINILSQAVLLEGKEGRAVYDASKWAVAGFSHSLAKEVAQYNIGVTNIYPGRLDKPMADSSRKATGESSDDALSSDDVAKTIEFVLGFDRPTVFPEIGIRHI